MQSFPPTVVLRHRKENLKKCSLRGIESRDDFEFYTYPKDTLPNMLGYICLSIDAPVLTEADADKGLFVLDGTWRYAEQMYKNTPGIDLLIPRSLPEHYQTAYRRKQSDCPDPDRGLASIEAIYVAYKILGRDTKGLLDHYHWKEEFLTKNNLSE